MAKAKDFPESAYGTKLEYKKMRSNHPVKSRYMAAALAMILGIAGVNQFYLRNIVRGILKIVLTLIFVIIAFFTTKYLMLIPVGISVLTGFYYLLQSDAAFAKKNHVRVL